MIPASPFNFVRLSKEVWLPDGPHSPASHDVAFESGLCGSIGVELFCHTPLMVGGERTKDGIVRFFRTPDGDRAIPGSSLRGLLRNIIEIAAFGRMQFVDDRRIGLRDLSGAAAQMYRRLMVEQVETEWGPAWHARPRGGWLTFDHTHRDGPAWVIRECEVLRIEHSLLEERIRAGASVPQRLIGPERRRILLRLNHTTAVKFVAPRQHEVVPVSSGELLRMRRVVDLADWDAADPAWLDKDQVCQTGWIVLTGHPGTRNRHRDFVLSEPPAGATSLPIPAAVWRDFLTINTGETWAEWRGMLDQREIGPGAPCHRPASPAEPGIPVFWLSAADIRSDGSPTEVASLGLAQMFKVALPLSIHDMIRQTDKAHLASGGPDLAQLLFGTAADDDAFDLRGRAVCGLARETPPFRDGKETDAAAEDEPASHSRETPPFRDGKETTLVLLSPKPTYYPFYVRQVATADLQGRWRAYAPVVNGSPEVRGWKRFQARTGQPNISPPPQQQQRVATTLQDPAAQRAKFTFTIRAHNLRPFELGAIVWALAFGEDPISAHGTRTYRHALGMGKPYGFGLVTFRVTSARLTRNELKPDGSEDVLSEQDALEELTRAMAAFKKRAGEAVGNWEGSAQIRQLRAMAKPRDPDSAPPLRYMVLAPPARDDFTALKNAGKTLPEPA